MQRNIRASFFDRVVDNVNNYLSLLVEQGAILDGICEKDPGRNTATTRAAGDAYFTLDYQPAFPVNRIIFTVSYSFETGQLSV